MRFLLLIMSTALDACEMIGIRAFDANHWVIFGVSPFFFFV